MYGVWYQQRTRPQSSAFCVSFVLLQIEIWLRAATAPGVYFISSRRARDSCHENHKHTNITRSPTARAHIRRAGVRIIYICIGGGGERSLAHAIAPLCMRFSSKPAWKITFSRRAAGKVPAERKQTCEWQIAKPNKRRLNCFAIGQRSRTGDFRFFLEAFGSSPMPFSAPKVIYFIMIFNRLCARESLFMS